jgi:hypothetical protein
MHPSYVRGQATHASSVQLWAHVTLAQRGWSYSGSMGTTRLGLLGLHLTRLTLLGADECHAAGFNILVCHRIRLHICATDPILFVTVIGNTLLGLCSVSMFGTCMVLREKMMTKFVINKARIYLGLEGHSRHLMAHIKTLYY